LTGLLFKNASSKAKGKNQWQVGHAAISPADPKTLSITATDIDGELINQSSQENRSVDCYTKAKFGDCRIELEVMIPKGSNSGIYVMGEYEIQVFDSYGVKNAKFVKVTLNGKIIHENVEMAGPTPTGVTGREAATGPLMFQGEVGPVAYRNIRITDLTGKL